MPPGRSGLAHSKSVLIVFGTRPEAIKLAPVALEMRRRGGRLLPRLITTGQHRDLLDGALGSFGLQADLDLQLMTEDQALSVLAGRALLGLDAVFTAERPSLVLVQGDATTTMCAALAAFHRRIPVGHVEAGLRTGNRLSPFPEEINRRLTTAVTDYHFAPIPRARDTLLAEGVPSDHILVTGNTVIDALFAALQRPCDPGPEIREVLASGDHLVLVTLHRRESFGPDLEAVCMAIRTLLERTSHMRVVFPLHPNPRVRETVPGILGSHPRAHLVEPLDYLPFVHTLGAARFVLTDSGGIQEEAPSLGKPTIVVRRVTERPEAIEAGNARLLGPDPEAIVALGERLLAGGPEYDLMSARRDVYGDGRAAMRIVDFLERQLA